MRSVTAQCAWDWTPQAARTANGPADNRHHIAHLQVVHPDDIVRFARLGVVANCQMYWALSDPQMQELTIPFLGTERAEQQYPFASLQRSGARLAGSDWSVSTANPLAQIEVGATRSTSERGEAAPFLPTGGDRGRKASRPSPRVRRNVNHDADGGVLALGKRADMVLLGADITRGLLRSGRGLADVPINMTIAAGRVVHSGLG